MTKIFTKHIKCLSLILMLLICGGCSIQTKADDNTVDTTASSAFVSTQTVSFGTEIPLLLEYTGTPYAIINNNKPFFSQNDITTDIFETYSDLDSLGRCQVAYANICLDLMPTTERESIGQVKPSGWHTINYHDLIDGNYLYNRCHLIGYQLAGENANEKNLITGTRYLNVEGMLPFENQIADYVKTTNHHVLYRVTPVFQDNELVCRGVLMEAQSVEDDNCVFCVYCFNVQPFITIDYTTGDSWVTQPYVESGVIEKDPITATYIINTNTHKIHKPDCDSVQDMNPRNKKEYHGDIQSLLDQGYDTCQKCNPR